MFYKISRLLFISAFLSTSFCDYHRPVRPVLEHTDFYDGRFEKSKYNFCEINNEEEIENIKNKDFNTFHGTFINTSFVYVKDDDEIITMNYDVSGSDFKFSGKYNFDFKSNTYPGCIFSQNICLTDNGIIISDRFRATFFNKQGRIINEEENVYIRDPINSISARHCGVFNYSDYIYFYIVDISNREDILRIAKYDLDFHYISQSEYKYVGDGTMYNSSFCSLDDYYDTFKIIDGQLCLLVNNSYVKIDETKKEYEEYEFLFDIKNNFATKYSGGILQIDDFVFDLNIDVEYYWNFDCTIYIYDPMFISYKERRLFALGIKTKHINGWRKPKDELYDFYLFEISKEQIKYATVDSYSYLTGIVLDDSNCKFIVSSYVEKLARTEEGKSLYTNKLYSLILD